MNFLKKNTPFILAAVGFFAALIFYSLNIPHKTSANVIERWVITVFAPIMKPFSQLSFFGENVWDNYIGLVHVRQENRQLREDIKALNDRVIAAEEVNQAYRRLARLLEVKNAIKAPTLTATVIGEDESPWNGTLVIDCGSSSGIVEGMAVVAADGIVGQVVKVSRTSSRVLLLTDHSSGIAATIQRSRARGVVKGKGDGLCQLEFTTREEDVKVGDVLVSSGIGGVFLKGSPIGEVTMVKRGEYGIFQTVTIRPFVNVSRLEDVLVVLRNNND